MNGSIIAAATKMSSAWAPRRRQVLGTWMGIISFIDRPAAESPVDQRDGENHGEEHPGDRGCVAHLKFLERLHVDVVSERRGRPRGPAFGHNAGDFEPAL